MAEHDGSIVIETGLDNDGFKHDSAKLLSAIERLTQKVDALGVGMKESFIGLSGMMQNITTATEAQAAAMSNSAQKGTAAASVNAKVRAATAEMAEATKAAAQEVQRLQREYAKVEKQIATAEKNLAAYNAELENIHQGTDEMLQQCETTDQVNKVLEIEKIQIDTLNQKYATQIETLRQLQMQQDSLQQQVTAAQATHQAHAEQLAAEQERVRAEIEKTKTAQNEGAEEHTSAFERMINNVRKYAHEAKKATIDSNKLVRSLTSLKRLMITRIKRMFISAIFKEVQTQLASLRQYYGAYNAAMERINGATSRAGAGIAIAIAHLVVTAEPFIVKLINLLTKAIDKINKFIALLTGVKNISSDELAGFTEALQGASEAQEQLNADLYGFDELNRQSKNVGTPTTAEPGTSGVPGTEEAEGTNTWLDKIKDNLGLIKSLALGVGAAFLTWKVGSAILKMLGKNGAMAKVRLAGLALGIGGLTSYVMNFINAWKNGLGNANIAGMLGSIAVAAVGLGVFHGITLAVGGLGMLVVGAREWIKTGELTTETFKTIELGIAALGVGIALATGSWIPLVVAAVAAGILAIYKYWDEIKAFFANLWTHIQEIGQNILIGLSEFWNNVLLALQTAWQWIVDSFMAFINWCVMLWQQLWAFAGELWNNIRTAIVTAVTTAVQTAQAKWNEFKANTVATFTTIKAKITSDIQTAKANMVAAVTSAKASVVASWNALLAACKSIFTGVKSTIMTMIYQASNFIASQSWYGYGVNLIQGFWNGLRSLMSAVWQSVVDFCRRCAEAVRNALRIGSPSKVFEELGEFTGMGFVEGLKNEESAAVKTAANLADAVTEEMSGSSSVDLSANGIQSVVNGLSTIAGIFQTIAKTLGAIGSLSAPQISAGTVIPSRARVNGQVGSENEPTDAVALLTSILAELQGLVQVIRSTGSNGTQIIKVIADGREIFNLVVDENNRAIQRTGQSPIRV